MEGRVQLDLAKFFYLVFLLFYPLFLYKNSTNNLIKFDFALLGKCYWRLKEKRGCLWYRILAIMYGEVGGVLVMVGGGRLCMVE